LLIRLCVVFFSVIFTLSLHLYITISFNLKVIMIRRYMLLIEK
jgi:hypothetical protein